jgi:hypothetical protein
MSVQRESSTQAGGSYNPPQTDVYEGRFPFYPYAIGGGLLTALVMGIYLFIVSMAANEPSTGLFFVIVFFLVPVLGLLLHRYKRALPAGKIFKDGIKLGAATSIATGLGLNLLYFVMYAVNVDAAANMFFYFDEGFGDVLVSSTMIVGIIFVFGMIITFCWLQYLKDGEKPADG